MKAMRWLMLIVGICTEASADVLTVDFETVAVDGELQTNRGGVFQGMYFVEQSGLYAMHLIDDGGCGAGCAASGSNSLLYEGVHNGGQPPLVIREWASLPFRLLGFDLGEVVPSSSPAAAYNAAGIGLVGQLAAGGTIQAFVDIDGFADGPGGGADFQAVTLDPSFADAILSRVDVWGLYESGVIPLPDEYSDPTQRAGFSLDNVLFDVPSGHVDFTRLDVPEPSTLGLVFFVSAIIAAVGGRAYLKARSSCNQTT